jgi:GTPase
VFCGCLSGSGHEKYFRTTAYGLTGHLPDYACLIVGANMGVVGMCKEHLGVALALKVPVFFVVTKVDICPEHVLKNTLQVSCRLCWQGQQWLLTVVVQGQDQ